MVLRSAALIRQPQVPSYRYYPLRIVSHQYRRTGTLHGINAYSTASRARMLSKCLYLLFSLISHRFQYIHH